MMWKRTTTSVSGEGVWVDAFFFLVGTSVSVWYTTVQYIRRTHATFRATSQRECDPPVTRHIRRSGLRYHVHGDRTHTSERTSSHIDRHRRRHTTWVRGYFEVALLHGMEENTRRPGGGHRLGLPRGNTGAPAQRTFLCRTNRHVGRTCCADAGCVGTRNDGHRMYVSSTHRSWTWRLRFDWRIKKRDRCV